MADGRELNQTHPGDLTLCVCARVHACACVCVQKRQNQNRTNGCQPKVTTLVNHYLCSSIKAHMMAG